MPATLGALHAPSPAVDSYRCLGGPGSRDRDLEGEAIAAQSHVLSKASGGEHTGVGASWGLPNTGLDWLGANMGSVCLAGCWTF